MPHNIQHIVFTHLLNIDYKISLALDSITVWERGKTTSVFYAEVYQSEGQFGTTLTSHYF